MSSENFDINSDNLTLRHRVYRCLTRRLFIIPLVVLFAVGLSLVVFSSYTLFHFHKEKINGKQKSVVILESNIAFGSIIAAGCILCLPSILSFCYKSWEFTFGKIMGYTWETTLGKIITLRAYVDICFLAFLLELMGVICAFLALSHIEKSEDGENTEFDGSNLYALGVFVAVIISLETSIACTYICIAFYSVLPFLCPDCDE